MTNDYIRCGMCIHWETVTENEGSCNAPLPKWAMTAKLAITNGNTINRTDLAVHCRCFKLYNRKVLQCT